MKRTFVQWFLLLLAYLVAAFFAQWFHLFIFVWNNDFTYMTSVIAVIFLIMISFLGYASWQADNNPAYANSVTIFARSAAYVVTLVGLLGTAIGLMYQVGALGTLNIADAHSLLDFVKTAVSSLSTALLSTACGIIASIGITIMNSNVEFHLDNKNEEPSS